MERERRVPVGIRTRFLADPSVWLWCWDLVDPEGAVVETSWGSTWAAYHSSAEALRAGSERLAEHGHTRRGAVMPGRQSDRGEPRLVDRLIIVARGDIGLYQSLQRSFADDDRTEVLNDRRFAERRQRRARPVLERRQRERRRRPDVDAQIRACGWSLVRRAAAAA